MLDENGNQSACVGFIWGDTKEDAEQTALLFSLSPSILAENETLKDQVKQLREAFYMQICRAYNAGKQNQINQQVAKGSPDEGKMFLSSHDYFLTEFPGFTTNVP